jgi:hypothetical protein
MHDKPVPKTHGFAAMRYVAAGCRTGGTAAPTRWPPRRSPQAFGRMSAPARPPVCARGRYHTRPAARRGVAGHRQVTGRAAARPVEAVGARGHRGGQCTGAAGSPGHPDKVWVARRPAVPKGRLDNHRRAPCSCYTPAPCGAHGAVPRPGMTNRQTLALTGHQCDPVFCAPPKSPGPAVGGVAWAAGSRRSPSPELSRSG